MGSLFRKLIRGVVYVNPYQVSNLDSKKGTSAAIRFRCDFLLLFTPIRYDANRLAEFSCLERTVRCLFYLACFLFPTIVFVPRMTARHFLTFRASVYSPYHGYFLCSAVLYRTLRRHPTRRKAKKKGHAIAISWKISS